MTTDLSHISALESLAHPNVSYDPEMLFEKIKTELAKFGLTPNQSKVFLHLEKFGPNTATQVSKALKVPRTETYHLLSNLQNKGIVSASFQHPIKFAALSLEKAIGTLINAEKERIKNLETHEKNLVELWSALPSFKINNDEIKDGKFQMLQGINQMSGKIKEMLTNSKETIQILASEKDFMKFYHAGYLEWVKDSKSDIQLVSSSSDKTEYIFDGKLIDKVKRMPLKVKEDLCFIITDDDQLILFMKKLDDSSQNIVAMWTDSYSMVYTLKLLFTYIWSNSKYLKHE